MQPHQSSPPFDPERMVRAVLVLRVKRVAAGGGSKFLWDEVDVLNVLKSASGQPVPSRLRVAHYSWQAGIPEGECTVYLDPYSDSDDGLWKLLDAKASSGVSHVVTPRP